MIGLRTIVLAVAITLLASPAAARPLEVERSFPSARMVGEVRYQFLAWPLFDAELWNASGQFSWSQPFALTLTYQRSFSTDTLTNRTLSEMAQRTNLDAAQRNTLREHLRACFPNVSSGDRITGVSTSADRARFYFNGARACEIAWPGFRQAFFGIWLDASGENRALSRRLRGEA